MSGAARLGEIVVVVPFEGLRDTEDEQENEREKEGSNELVN